MSKPKGQERSKSNSKGGDSDISNSIRSLRSSCRSIASYFKSKKEKEDEEVGVSVSGPWSDDVVFTTDEEEEVQEEERKKPKVNAYHKSPKSSERWGKRKVIASSEEDDPDSDVQEVTEIPDSDVEVEAKVKVEAKPKKLKINGRKSKSPGEREGSSSSIRKSLRSSCRSIASYFEASSSSEDEEDIDIDLDSDFEEVKDKPKKSKIQAAASKCSRNRKRKSAKTGSSKSIASYFGGKSPPTPPSKDEKKKPVLKKRKLDPATLAFLSSGVPEVVVRAQKAVDLKREEDEFLSLMGFFPKVHNVNLNHPDVDDGLLEENLDELKIPMKKDNLLDEDVSEDLNLKSFFQTVNVPIADLNTYQFCCNLKSFKSSVRKKSLPAVQTTGIVDNLPWIDRLKADSVKALVGNGEGVEKLKQWLKQWKLDIKDSGGICRKVEKKKRKKGSDSEFVDSEEEEDEIKNKSVLISGPSGCGKSAAVYVLAKHYGFYVVEVNFSTRRPGKDVLQRVEEAVLSHRLESSQNCLLLFKDIDLLDAEEDEGFHAAVAQLISTAVRPIVMTTCLSVNSSLECKIQRRNPLRIHFNYPHSRELVHKVLLPNVFQLSGSSSNPSKELQQHVKAQLDSLCRHNRGDIRQSINQAQFLFTSGQPVPSKTLHMHSTSSSELLDFWHVIPTHSSEDDNSSSGNSQACDEDDQLYLTLKARKKLQLQELETLSSALSSLSDLDLLTGSSTLSKAIRCDVYREEEDVKSSLSSLHTKYFYPDFISKLKNSSSAKVSKSLSPLLKRLTFESDVEVDKAEEATGLLENLDEYLDSYGEGSWAPAATLRTIIKQNVMDSVGRLAKRNGRVTNYFNRLDKGLVRRVCNTFGFSDELEAAKEFVQSGPF